MQPENLAKDVGSGFARHGLFGNPNATGLENGFPFATALSMELVIEKWRTLSVEDPDNYASEWRVLEAILKRAPQLGGPIDDALLAEHKDVLTRLVRPLFPSDAWQPDLRALAAPFGGDLLIFTERYGSVFGHDRSHIETINLGDPYMRTLYAYRAILHRHYGITLNIDQPLIFDVPRGDTGLSHYYKLNASSNLITIKLRGELPELTAADIESLLDNASDMGMWMKRLPPDRFEFVGVSLVSMTRITDETATASITHTVLTADADINETNFGFIEREIRNLFGLSDLRLGLASRRSDGTLAVMSDREITNSLVIRDALRKEALDWKGTIYERALNDGRVGLVPDVENAKLDDSLRTCLLTRGVRSLYIQPLKYRDNIVGLLELSSSRPRAFDSLTGFKVHRIKTVFALAVYQNLSRFENRVDATVQKRYTAIHPSVSWRFRQAAVRMLQRGRSIDDGEAESISFPDLYPLYASADITGSTLHRNEAVRADTLRKLLLAREAVSAIGQVLPLTILNELQHRIQERQARYASDWRTGDSDDASRFLDEDVNGMLSSVVDSNPNARAIFDAYREDFAGSDGASAPLSGAYEESESAVNALIVNILQEEQADAQRVFPHYFEYAQTDGIEYTMFIGQSIAPDRRFDVAFVQDQRLRQLILACRIARRVRAVRDDLSVPLDVAQLILVQTTPVGIAFRTDEKRFSVEGASGVRFELLKKRLEKGVTRGTDDRLTRPDHIAVVYSLPQEATEYRRYIAYLGSNGYIDGDVEDYEVGDLQGVTGLHMLRLRVT